MVRRIVSSETVLKPKVTRHVTDTSLRESTVGQKKSDELQGTATPSVEQLTLEKLRLEIRNLKTKWYKQPLIWLTIVTTVTAVLALFYQMSIAEYRKVKLEYEVLESKNELRAYREKIENLRQAVTAQEASNLSNQLNPTTTHDEINRQELAGLLSAHSILESNGKEGERAELSGVDFRNLASAQLIDANLAGAILAEANFQNLKLTRTNLEKAILTRANFQGADLSGANLSDADLSRADLSNTLLLETKFSNANFDGVNLSGAVFEPRSLPRIETFDSVLGLSEVRFDRPSSLYELRRQLRNAGLRLQERQVTYVLNRVSIRKRFTAEGLLRYVLFEITCAWGLSPGRALKILVLIMLCFSLVYTYVVRYPSDYQGIWRIWADGVVELVNPRGILQAFLSGVYFAVLSSFNIGWKDAAIAGWILRIVPDDYTLRPTGWVKTVSGIQSLISVYLIALWFLTYFFRPFD